MLGELSVLYLFLGGTGAACLGVCCLADLLRVRQAFGVSSENGLSAVPQRRALAMGLLAGWLLLAFGMLCLLLDLGKTDRALDILVSGTLNLMTAGLYGLIALAVLGAVATAVRCCTCRPFPRLRCVWSRCWSCPRRFSPWPTPASCCRR